MREACQLTLRKRGKTSLADYAKPKEDRNESFEFRDFFDRLNAIGCIPISLARWEMTGLDDEIRRLAADVSSP